MSIYNYRYHRTHFQIYTIPIFESFARSNIQKTVFLFIYPAAADYMFLKAIWTILSMSFNYICEMTLALVLAKISKLHFSFALFDIHSFTIGLEIWINMIQNNAYIVIKIKRLLEFIIPFVWTHFTIILSMSQQNTPFLSSSLFS